MNPHDHADLSVNGWNAEYIEAQYRQWQNDAASVGADWHRFFLGFELGCRRAPQTSDTPTGQGTFGHVAHTRQGRVDSLIHHYRDIGHLAAELDPLGFHRPFPEQLRLESFELSEADLDATFDPGHLPLANPASLRDIVALLTDTYCRHVGAEYMHVQDRTRRRWLQKRMEPIRNAMPWTADDKRRILGAVTRADAFESFLNTRYRGKKRFGLDGGESLIAMLSELAEEGPGLGIEEFAIAMAHRGRLNVLANILHKSYDQIFTEFEEAWEEDFIEGGGDVKYHRGFSGDFPNSRGEVMHLTLSPNPSHLEFANSVVLGRTRAKQRLREDLDRVRCVPVLIHGDASFPGQGIVAECFNMMRLDGYTVGGALHFIVNNQVGFTTDPRDSHGGRYCTDLARMIDAPIFHVNGDDPEACVFATRLALEFRQQFKCDVVVDLWCFRRHGHNEGDEPTFTQPLMYERVKEKESVARIYARQLEQEGVLQAGEFDGLVAQTKTQMDAAQSRTKENPVEPNVRAFRNEWTGLTHTYHDRPVATKVPIESLQRVGDALARVPDGFSLHKKLERLLEYRGKAARGGEPVDWGLGELFAFGTLLLEGHPVRLTGQDVERGTFSQRHAVLFDQKSGQGWMNLSNIAPGQARLCVHNSPLTEAACLGFEYGYSLGDPRMLVVWEAQFGDFANGAQVIIDQFIASAEIKWRRHSGLVLLLPHGYEGQGPEHSSARLERFLLLCAKDNMQVCYPTTPAQHFHLLRRQMKRDFRKPLVVLSPKSLLRHPEAVSPIEAFTDGAFEHFIDDPSVRDPQRITRVLLCSGKIYYDLLAERKARGREDVAIVRVEQLYPFNRSIFSPILERYRAAKERVWVQEEPMNMGAWRYIDPLFREQMGITLACVAREANSTPAVASTKIHGQEQQRLLAAAIPPSPGDRSPSAPSPSKVHA